MLTPSDDWHAVARQLWDAAAVSSASGVYEATDWVVLWHACEQLSYLMYQPRRSSQFLAEVNKLLTSLGLTAADRAKAGGAFDVKKGEERAGVDEGVARLADYMAEAV